MYIYVYRYWKKEIKEEKKSRERIWKKKDGSDVKKPHGAIHCGNWSGLWLLLLLFSQLFSPLPILIYLFIFFQQPHHGFVFYTVKDWKDSRGIAPSFYIYSARIELWERKVLNLLYNKGWTK